MEGLAAPFSIRESIFRVISSPHSARSVSYTHLQETALGSEGAVAVHIRHLREKIEINPSEPRYLKVVWGQGYKMEATVR